MSLPFYLPFVNVLNWKYLSSSSFIFNPCFLFGLLHLSFIKYFFISAKFNKYQLINWISQIKQIIIIDIYWAPLAWQDRYMKQKSCNTVWVLNCCQLILVNLSYLISDIIECSALKHKADVIYPWSGVLLKGNLVFQSAG